MAIHLRKDFAMKNVWRGLITIIALAAAISSPAVAGELKIAAVDRAKVLKECQTGKKSTAALQDFAKARQKIVEMDESDLAKMSEEFTKQAAVLSPEARKDKEETFFKKRNDFQRKVGELEREIQARQRELGDVFNKQFDDVVKVIAEKEKYYLVVDSSLGTQTVYNNPAIDITDRVIKEMDRASK